MKPPLTFGRLWWLLQRDYKRGFRATWGYHVLRPNIWSWQNPYAARTEPSLAVHLLCGRDQVDLAAWMMASWIVQTGRNWRFVLHDDGSLHSQDVARLRALGLALQIITRAEADQRLAQIFADRPAAAAYRERHPLALKIFDAPVFAAGDRFLLLDTDVLFFRPPARILEWVEADQDDTTWFNADCAEAANVSPAEAAQLGISLWPKVNSGLCLLGRNVIDLDLCERALNETGLLRGHVWRVEQTLFALCASLKGRGGLLPATYEVTLGRYMRRDAVARHYVGAVRDRFWAEGVGIVRRVLFSR